MSKTDLIIIGGGAAGLMAGASAGELGLRTVVLERKHKPGRKLLMCGNSRCNLTTNISAERMVQMFGAPVGPFMEPALNAFSPSALQRWFAVHGLKTAVKAGNKVYPQTERAADVLAFFLDRLRDMGVSLACSAPVEEVRPLDDGFLVETENFAVQSRYLLVATGGVSYPKTGSVGDGQKWAAKMGHQVTPLRGGLVGFEVDPSVLKGRVGTVYDRVQVHLMDGGKKVAETRGVYEIETWGVGGTALTDASRIAARMQLDRPELVVCFEDGSEERIAPLRPRPLKEAMVTVGGISLSEINRNTMESIRCNGLYFAGELMDVDGPTGGYNLQAAFSSARLAVGAIAQNCGKGGYLPLEKVADKKRAPKRQAPKGRRRGAWR